MRLALRVKSWESQALLEHDWDHADYHLDTEGRSYNRVLRVVDFGSRYLDGGFACYLIRESATISDVITCVECLNAPRRSDMPDWDLQFVVVDK